MSDDPSADDEEIRAALDQLNRLIAHRVQREQRRDQLTGLANELALDECLERHIRDGRDVCAVFVEVDKFKTINDQFGCQNADELLKSIAKLLEELSTTFPATDVAVFRPHGDEFFIVGVNAAAVQHRADALARVMDLVITKVRSLGVTALRASSSSDAEAVSISCTVSVGWLVAEDVPPPLTARSIRSCLERAVDEAKLQRDCAVRYAAEMKHRRARSLRGDCGSCRSTFTVDVPADDRRDSPMHCPNYGGAVERPASGASEPIEVQVSEI